MKFGIGVGNGPTRFVGIFSKRPHQRSKVIQRSSCPRNALWLPNLIGRTPEQSVMHYWVKDHAGVTRPPDLVGRTSDQSVMHYWGSKVMQGSAGVNHRSNCSEWPPNLVERTSDQSVMHCWCQRSYRGSAGGNYMSNCSGMVYGYQILQENS